jgi:hypothetical protein
VISSSAASRTRKDYTSSARHGKSLHSCKGDRTRLLPPPDTRRRRHQQLVERRPALSVVRVVSRLLWGLKSTRLPQDFFAASGLRVQALVSGLLSKIQC